MRTLTLATLLCAVLLLITTDSGQAKPPGFIRIDGKNLEAKLDAAIKQGRAQQKKFWVAYSFDVRPPASKDYPNLPTPNLGIFMLYEPSGNSPLGVEVYNLDNQEYEAHPVYWLGRSAKEESFRLLAGLAESNEGSDIAKHSIMAIALHQEPGAASLLENLAGGAHGEALRKTAMFWLAQVPGAHPSLAEVVRNEQENLPVRKEAAYAIAVGRDPAALSILESLYAALNEREIKKQIVFAASVIRNGATSASTNNGDKAISFLTRVAENDPDSEVRKHAIFWLGQKGGARGLEALEYTLADKSADIDVQKEAVYAISLKSKDEAVPRLIKIAETHQNPAVREQATFWLRQTNDLRTPVPATAKEAVGRAVEIADNDRPKESVALLRKAISIAPQYLAAHVQYIRIKTFYLDRYDEVRQEYDALMLRQPENAVYPMALAMATGSLVPEPVKREWFAKVSKLAPNWAWGHYAKAKLVSEQDAQAAAAELLESLAQDGTATEPYEMLISLQKNKLAKLDDALKTAERMYAQTETRAAGLYQLSNLRLAKANGSEQARAAVRDELDRLSASSTDVKMLASVRDVYTELLYDRERTLKVENKLHQIDPGWYPERGWTFVLPTANSDGVPRQVPMSGHRVTVLFKAYFIGDDLEANVKTARLEQLLGETTDRDVKWYIYSRLFNSSEKSNDHAAVVKYGEALRALDHSGGVAWLAKIALALADEKKDLNKALNYARLADDKTAKFQVALKPRNTDAEWFKEAATPDWQKQNYQEQRALALDAHGWVLSRLGNAGAAEAKLRESLKISRSEKKLLHLADALRQLGRTEETEKVISEARDEYAAAIKRKFVNEAAKDFELEATDGRKVKLSDLKGKPVMLYFLATWCAACSKEGPYLVKFYEKYKPSGFEILAISIDEAADRHKVAPLAKELNYTFPVLLDEGVAKTYNVQGVPMSMIFIDRKGNVRYRQQGFFEETPRDLEIVIQELLK